VVDAGNADCSSANRARRALRSAISVAEGIAVVVLAGSFPNLDSADSARLSEAGSGVVERDRWSFGVDGVEARSSSRADLL
jgi:hypothetical protein